MLAAVVFTQAQTIQQTYHFSQPTLSERDGYQQIGFQGCLPNGIVGEPTLPWQSVSLMLPQGQEAVSIHVELSDFIELEGIYNLYPYQKPRPLSSEEVIPFAKNEPLYRSENAYPTRNYSAVSTQYLNGVGFAFSAFTPLQYKPATGSVSYAQTVTVTIETTSSRADHSQKLWLTPENEASVKRLAQNANMLDSYSKRGREIGGYDMLVITAEEWIPSFGDYLNLYNDKGIRTRIVALEDIYNNIEGRDEQEQIRNYIIQEYEENGIQMVSLGGDVSIVPYRSLYCWAQEGEEDQLPADMYYACLDGTLNDDNDDRWGEVGEDDLLPEIGIGRLPFNNETQFQTIMHKTFSYLQTPVMGEFTSPVLGAEHLGDGYFGSDDMERLIGENNDFDYTTYGYSEDYNFKRYYETPYMSWNGSNFKAVFGTGGQYVHHVGHANDDYVAGWTGSMMGNNYFPGNDGINHNYQIFHSHGCICGNFPVSCVLEKMVTIETGFVLTTGNSRYGWYVPWGDGMAAHIHREFVDAYCNDLIPTVGMALREAKIATAPWVAIPFEEQDPENGCLRWNIYCLNVLGDVALYPWFEEPFTPDVFYQQGILRGTASTLVTVKANTRLLEGFRVSLFKGDELMAFAMTDANGNAVLEFDDPDEIIGEMRLIVTGQSAWPQQFTVMGIDENEPYLFVSDFVYNDMYDNYNGIPENGETIHLGLAISNPGTVDINNVSVDVTCDDPQIEVTQSHSEYALVPAEGNIVTGDGGTFVISDDAIDQSRVMLHVACTAEGNTWFSDLPIHISAPNLQYAEIVVDDSQGDQNGFIDQGELITLQVYGLNAGHALAPDTYLSATCDDERLHFIQSLSYVGDLEADDTFVAEISFTSDDDILGGTLFHIDMELHSGAYVVPFDYTFSIGVTTETFESGDFSYLAWEHGGDQHWFVTDTEAHSGLHSVRSGAIADDEVSNLAVYTEVYYDGEISFWFKTSTEYHKDYFAFFIDGRKADWWSGENDWTYVSYEFEAGPHVFEWLYDKNKSGIAGDDCVWIDDITFPRATIITAVEETTSKKENHIYPNPTNGTFTIALAEESSVSVYNVLGQNLLNLNKASGMQQLQLNESGVYFVRISNGNGVEVKKLIVE